MPDPSRLRARRAADVLSAHELEDVLARGYATALQLDGRARRLAADAARGTRRDARRRRREERRLVRAAEELRAMLRPVRAELAARQ